MVDPAPSSYVPFWLGGAIRGRVRGDVAQVLAELPGIEAADLGFRLSELGVSRSARSRAFQQLGTARG